MKIIHGSCAEDYEVSDYKTCPVCGAVCFADMETCFGCLHHFSEEDSSAAYPHSSGPMSDGAASPEEVSTKARLEEEDDRNMRADAQGPIDPPKEETGFDHTQDIAKLKKPSRSHFEVLGHSGNTAEEPSETVSRHICSDKEGRQFEISISVKLL